MKIHIKNMVCSRCKMVVKAELEKLGLHPLSVALGEVEIKEKEIDNLKENLCANLRLLGFELIDDDACKTIDKIKTLIIELVHHRNNELNINLSEYLATQLLQDYHSLSSLFSKVEQLTIEHYYIKQKVERVKELLMYDEMTLSQIADLLHYSSVAYLSNQFKKETGFTTTYFKQLKTHKRKGIENIS